MVAIIDMADSPSVELTGVLDADAHEMAPSHLWGEIFGDAAGKIAVLVEPLIQATGENNLFSPSYSEDSTAMTVENVWNVRGVKAPGAFDMARRIEAMDVMGFQRQLIFPSFGVLALQLLLDHSMMRDKIGETGLSKDELIKIGHDGINEYNEWAIKTTAFNSDRLRPVACLMPGISAPVLIDQAQMLVDRGIRAVHMNTGTPLGGLSPAHPDLDPLWALFAERDITATVHVGGDGDFLNSRTWVQAPAFAPGKVESHEIGLEPYSMTTFHYSASNFLVCMTLGGVFERHPNLRFGVIECGAHWLGPLAESLDMWATNVFAKRLEPFISMLPSEYFNRNVRVTPFNDIEPIDEYFKKFPQLSDCFCYSSDYPHVEGGKDSKRKTFEKVAALGEDYVQKFFESNARLLFPD
jgi:predicted TIM-barrel fold metal-dependent hydrolase